MIRDCYTALHTYFVFVLRRCNHKMWIIVYTVHAVHRININNQWQINFVLPREFLKASCYLLETEWVIHPQTLTDVAYLMLETSRRTKIGTKHIENKAQTLADSSTPQLQKAWNSACVCKRNFTFISWISEIASTKTEGRPAQMNRMWNQFLQICKWSPVQLIE